MSLLILGINHNTAPVDVRERVSFSPEGVKAALESLLQVPGIHEASVLSTCNRTEITCWAEHDDVAEATTHWLANHHSIDPNLLRPYLYLHEDSEAVRHTLRVACGLDSLVLGEPQILGQLKQSFQVSQDHQSMGRHLKRLYQHAFSTAKQVRTETAIGESAVSVAFAAVSLAKQIFGDLDKQHALLIGAGETIELTARHLNRQKVGQITIANRTVKRAADLAAEFGGNAISLEDIPEHLANADIIISSTGSPLPILGKGAVERALKKRKHRPMFMVDIAVPRDIEAEVGDMDDVYLYTVDNLHDVIHENLKSRQQAAEQAEELVAQQVHHFLSWLRSQEALESIRHYRQKAFTERDRIRMTCDRLLQQGKPVDEVLDFMAHTLTNKLIHPPTACLNQAAREGDMDTLRIAHKILGVDIDNES